MFDSVERFDLSEEEKYVIKGEWTHMPPLICARGRCGAAVVAGDLYVVGGEKGEHPSVKDTCSSVERLQLSSSRGGKEWKKRYAMTTKRARGAVVVA